MEETYGINPCLTDRSSFALTSAAIKRYLKIISMLLSCGV